MKNIFLLIQCILTSLTNTFNFSMHHNFTVPFNNINNIDPYNNTNNGNIILDSSTFLKPKRERKTKNKRISKQRRKTELKDGEVLKLNEELLNSAAKLLNKKLSTDFELREIFQNDFDDFNLLCFQNKLVSGWKTIIKENYRIPVCLDLVRFYKFIVKKTYDSINLMNIMREIYENKPLLKEVVSKFIDSIDIKIEKNTFYTISQVYDYNKHIEWTDSLKDYWNNGSKRNNGLRLIKDYVISFKKNHGTEIITINCCKKPVLHSCNKSDGNKNSIVFPKSQDFSNNNTSTVFSKSQDFSNNNTSTVFSKSQDFSNNNTSTALPDAMKDNNYIDNTEEIIESDFSEIEVLSNKSNLTDYIKIENNEKAELKSKTVFNEKKIDSTTTPNFLSEGFNYLKDIFNTDLTTETPEDKIQFSTTDSKNEEINLVDNLTTESSEDKIQFSTTDSKNEEINLVDNLTTESSEDKIQFSTKDSKNEEINLVDNFTTETSENKIQFSTTDSENEENITYITPEDKYINADYNVTELNDTYVLDSDQMESIQRDSNLNTKALILTILSVIIGLVLVIIIGIYLLDKYQTKKSKKKQEEKELERFM